MYLLVAMHTCSYFLNLIFLYRFPKSNPYSFLNLIWTSNEQMVTWAYFIWVAFGIALLVNCVLQSYNHYLTVKRDHPEWPVFEVSGWCDLWYIEEVVWYFEKCDVILWRGSWPFQFVLLTVSDIAYIVWRFSYIFSY